MKVHLIAAVAVMCGASVLAQETKWPDFIGELKAAPTKSPVEAPLPPTLEIKPPASDVSPERAKWSGRWDGWACTAQSCDTKLAVLSVTNDGASIVYTFASAQVTPVTVRLQAKFVGDELQATFGSGSKLSYRMRASGEVEYHLLRSNGFTAGLLTKKV